jgi:prepilin-type N-terminal cleavage/methylation domain-containing protein
MKTRHQTEAGFTLVEIMVVVAIIGLLVTIAIPSYFKNREVAQKNTCLSNLRVIDTAKQLWGIENGKGTSDVADDADLVGDDLYLRRKPECPSGGEYTYWEIGELPECNIAGHVLPGSQSSSSDVTGTP